MRLPIIALLLFYWPLAQAEDLPLQELLPDGSEYALLVKPLGEQTTPVMQHNADLLLPPASTQKILTALAAKLYLGNEFRFTTPLEKLGDDLVLRFSGDPTLTRAHLQQLLEEYRKQGGSALQDLWLDNTAFGGHDRATGWPWEGLSACYSAPSNAISLDHNCFEAAVYGDTPPGTDARPNLPAHQPVTLTSNAKVTKVEEILASRCELDLRVNDSNVYQLSGCLGPRKDPYPLKLAVQNPELFTQRIVEGQLKKLGITLKGKVRIGAPPASEAEAKTIATHRSDPLPALLDTMLKESDNLIADTLLRTLGARYSNHPGSYANGTAALRKILKEKAGIALPKAILEDGSGLSRNNRLTARQLAEVMHYMALHDEELQLVKMLPVSGVSGTLQFRASVRKPPLQGKLAAKTGSLFGTKNLTGVLTSGKGNKLVMSLIVTNYFPTGDDNKEGKPVHQLEARLFKTLYERY